ncbi:tetratricopeptide repeat protein [Krasilnikovia sp. MM14-A1259]|uniref:tetratricopeptide repeat protein n=1 Tax=Krasilnikovia sp. MM14-A1259 TaxID=3373539 RepID=UPI00399D1E85
MLTVLGLIGLSWPWLARAAAAYIRVDLATRDQMSSVAGFWIGVAALATGIIQLVREGRKEAAANTVAPVTAGMSSLTVPDLMPGERVRGRDALIADLVRPYWRRLIPWRRRVPRRVRVLHGMGGAGKSVVAAHAARQLEQRGVTAWWISAAEATELQTGLWQLARLLGATVTELTTDWATNAPDVLWRRLNGYPGRWLLVLDNADDTRLLTGDSEPVWAGRGWIRQVQTPRGMLLITSRDGDRDTWITDTGHRTTRRTPAPQNQLRGAWSQMDKVDMLAPAEAAQVLCDRTGPHAGTLIEATELAERLGQLPLALGLVGRYLHDAQQLPLAGAITTFTAYQNALRADGVAAVFDRPGGELTPAQARQLIDRTWELSLDLLDDRSQPQARPLLRLLALLADAPIPCHLIDTQVLAASTLFADLTVNRLNGLLRALTGLGLLEALHTGAKSTPREVSIHPLIRDVSLQHLHDSDDYTASLELAVRLIDNATTDDPTDPMTWPTWRALAPHALHLISVFESTPAAQQDSIEAAAHAARKATEYLDATGLYGEARDRACTIHRICQRLLGEVHPETLRIQVSLAHWTAHVGDEAAARDQLAALFPVIQRALGVNHPDTLATRHRLAHLTGALGDVVAARDQLAALLPIREQVLGALHPESLVTRSGMAFWTAKAGNPVSAREQFAALLPAQQHVLGAAHPDTLATRTGLALQTGDAGDPVAARDQLAALLPVRERVLGTAHPETLITRAFLARWTGEAGDPETARDQLADLLPAVERVLGTAHPETLITRAFLARWTGEAGDPETARDQLADLLPAAERVLGTDHAYAQDIGNELARWSHT